MNTERTDIASVYDEVMEAVIDLKIADINLRDADPKFEEVAWAYRHYCRVRLDALIKEAREGRNLMLSENMHDTDSCDQNGISSLKY